MTHELKQRELVINLSTCDLQISPLDHEDSIIGPVDYGWVKYNRAAHKSIIPPEIMTWGGGPLAGSRIPGTRRLVFCGYSPQWEGFYISSLGGAAYIMHRLGVDFISIRGAASQDSVLILNHRQGEISGRLEPINPDLLWTGYADPEGERLIGFYAMQQAIFDRYSKEYEPDWVRIFTVGPAARLTNQGIIGSSVIRKGRITGIEDWAGRGGLGSRLLQTHHIAACIFGGDWEDPDLKDSKEIDGYFRQFYGDSMLKVDLGATEKYRYIPGFQTGGTFGSNMRSLDDNLLSFNYTSIYQSDQERLDQHSHFILDHYLKQFNEEIIKPRNFAHCGEPCSVACKKYDRIYKKDYEPYQALGPLCGVFNQRAAEELNHFVDAMGLDAIQTGGTVAWIMELESSGIISPQDFGLPPRQELVFNFVNTPDKFDLVNDSRLNAEYAQKVINMILFEPVGEPFRSGIRCAAKYLDEYYHLDTPGKRTIDKAVYNSHGTHGNMTPNQYWAPGMFSPMPLMGKYFNYYGVDYLPPRQLGHRCVERMVYELFSENSGVCRFHRKWAEAIVDEIISSHYHLQVDYKSHQYKLAQQIYLMEGGKDQITFWENERTIDIIAQYLEKWDRFGLKDESLHHWLALFREDKWKAARAYWEELYTGIKEAFTAGASAIPDIVPPYQSTKGEFPQPL